jgi:hypothetical protein
MRVVDSTKVKFNLSQDVGRDDPYSLILLSIKNEIFLVLLDLESQPSYTITVLLSSIVYPYMVPILHNLICL